MRRIDKEDAGRGIGKERLTFEFLVPVGLGLTGPPGLGQRTPRVLGVGLFGGDDRVGVWNTAQPALPRRTTGRRSNKIMKEHIFK